MVNCTEERCSRCGKEFEDVKVDVVLLINPKMKKENGLYESMPNSETNSREILCFECFEKFSDAFESLNYNYEEELVNQEFEEFYGK